jgi:CheY-like chemotaxis protein
MTATQHVAEQLPATILVVDNAPASRYIAGSWLRKSGHRVIEPRWR